MVNLKELKKAAIAEFGPLLEKAGFKHKLSKADKYGFRTTFVSDDRYVEIYANCHPRDYPPYFNVVLGEGSLESPDNDWNSVALWRMRSDPEDGSEYRIEAIKSIDDFVHSVRTDFELLAKGFLTGDLKAFHRIRAAQTKTREPYLIHKPDKNGRYRTRPEPESVRLKEKYSKE